MAGAGAVRKIGSWILTVCVLVYVHLQIAVGAYQPPLRNDFPVCKQFHAVSSAAHLVSRDKGDDDIGRSGTPFDERRTARRCEDLNNCCKKLQRRVRGWRLPALYNRARK